MSPVLYSLYCWLLLLSSFQEKTESQEKTKQKHYHKVHSEAIVVDGHNDILMRVMAGERVDVLTSKGHSDLPRFRAGGVDAQVFSIWVPPEYDEKKEAWKYANNEIDSLDAIIVRNPDAIMYVRNGAELRQAVKQGKLAAIIGIEGGHAIENSAEKLVAFHRRGLRSFGLTWNNSTTWASSSKDESEGKKQKGLTDFGKSLVRFCDSLGILIDISHLGSESVKDVLATSRNPIIASHSACTSLRDHHRNLTDDQLRAIAKNGGVVMVNFYPSFIKSGIPKNSVALTAGLQKRMNALKGSDHMIPESKFRERLKIIREAKRKGLATIDDVIAHIEHVIRVAGIDHVGLGSDFDGIDHAPLGLGEVNELPNLTRAFLQKGYPPSDIEKILGLNFLRVFERVCR